MYDQVTGEWIEESAGTEVRTGLADGAAPPVAPDGIDPRILSRQVYDSLMENGATREEAAGEAFSVIAQAAMAGDRRVVVDKEWQPLRWASDPRRAVGADRPPAIGANQ